uniref:Peptidase A2 domain-containing protein n=1 Tax=Bracon brevicornis TaxID=1563983 RepID=A0A6V7KN09_9HYME
MIKALLDTGAHSSHLGSIGQKVAEELNLPILKTSAIEAVVADGSKLPVLGIVKAPTTIDGVTKVIDFRVTPALKDKCILGMDCTLLFGMTLNCEEEFWKIKEGSTKHPFASKMKKDRTENCWAIAELSKSEEERLNEFIRENVDSPPDEFGVTHLTTHHIDVQGHPPINQRCYLTSP